MADICRECRRPYELMVPEKWGQRYPALKNLCPDCAARWIIDNIPEDRPQQQPADEPAGGWLDQIGGAAT